MLTWSKQLFSILLKYINVYIYMRAREQFRLDDKLQNNIGGSQVIYGNFKSTLHDTYKKCKNFISFGEDNKDFMH